MVRPKPSPFVIAEVTDPEELAQARAQRERFDRNAAWFRSHAQEIYARHRGKCVVIAAERVFVGDTPKAAWDRVAEAQIEDEGSFSLYIPKEKLARIYAHSR
jgi:hypothetical protein